MSFNKIPKKPIIISSLVIVLVATLGITLLYKTKKADAVAINLAGRAQISNTSAYLDFTDFSANVTTSNIGCEFDGYAWSSDIGWVAFGATDNPDGPVTCDLTTGVLSGKARVINDGSTIDFNAAPYNSNVRILSSGDFTGYAWSTALGWINFTGVSAPGISLVVPKVVGRAQISNTSAYLNFTDSNANVTISNISGQFDGYAWSSDIGWVAFGATDNPDGPVTCDLTTGILSGKARVINDGSVIDFNSAPYNSNVRILSSGGFTGYAWSTALGWINFTSVLTTGISLTNPEIPPTVTPTATPTSTPTSTATATPSATPTSTPTSTATAIPTPSPTATPSPLPLNLTVWDPINMSPQDIKEDAPIMLYLHAENSDSENVFGINNPPPGSSIDQTNQTFLWRPNFDQAGDYNLEFYAHDGARSANYTYTISVKDNGSVPEEKGAESVLILVNQNSPESIAVGQYYQSRRQVPTSQILGLNTTTQERISLSDYNSQIKEPIKTFLNNNNLKEKIRYIVPTYGIPTTIISPRVAVDSYLSDLFDTMPADPWFGVVNPYWKGSIYYSYFFANGFHFPPSHFPSELSTYLVSRLDGTSLKISEGLVDKAIYAQKYTGPRQNNQAYVLGQGYFGDSKSVICGLIEKAGYNCTQSTGSGNNPLWLQSPGNEYYNVWGNWRPGSVPLHFQSYTATSTIRKTDVWSQSVVAFLLAADATATSGVVAEPYATGIPQPAAFFDYFLNGGDGVAHYNFAESIYMSTRALKWNNIVVGDPLYKLSANPATDNQPPKIENVKYSCADDRANVSWDNPTAVDGSPEVSYGSVDYGLTDNYGAKLWDETSLKYYGVAKKNYLSKHSFQIDNIDCTKEYYFKIDAIDPEANISSYSFILNNPVEPNPVVAEPTASVSPNIAVIAPASNTTSTPNDNSVGTPYMTDGSPSGVAFDYLSGIENLLEGQAPGKNDPILGNTVPADDGQKATKKTPWTLISALSAALILSFIIVKKIKK